mgnify:CR=1 FL=1
MDDHDEGPFLGIITAVLFSVCFVVVLIALVNWIG